MTSDDLVEQDRHDQQDRYKPNAIRERRRDGVFVTSPSGLVFEALNKTVIPGQLSTFRSENNQIVYLMISIKPEACSEPA